MLNTLVIHSCSGVFIGTLLYFLPSCVLGLIIKLTLLCSFLYVTYLLGGFIDHALPRFKVKAKNKAVFITGCDSGFGLLLAERLNTIGFKVFAGCLDPKSKGAVKLKTLKNVQIVHVDVTKDDSVECALNEVKNNLSRHQLWAVVNNAGVIERGELEWTGIDMYQKQLEVNTLGVARVTKAFLPLLRKSKGRVVTITSTGGRITFCGFVPYCMSKHASSSFCDGLRLEMAKFGVKVVTVEPIGYYTNMTDTDVVLQSVKNNWSKASEELKKDVYDSDYINAYMKAYRKFNDSNTNPQVHQAIGWMVEAVTAKNPHYAYIPSDSMSLIKVWLVQRFPVTLANYFLRKTVTFDSDVEKYLKEKKGR